MALVVKFVDVNWEVGAEKTKHIATTGESLRCVEGERKFGPRV